MKSLEERIARLEARAAIQDLVVGYFLAADGDDARGVGDAFAEAAEFRSSGTLNAVGRQEIVDFIGQSRKHMGLTLHTPHYAQVSFDSPVEAHGLVGAHLEMVLAGSSIYGAVRYLDHYVNDGAQWRIQARDMRTIFIAPWLEAGLALYSERPVRWPGSAPASSDFPRQRTG